MWDIAVYEGLDRTAWYTTTHGQEGGAMQETTVKVTVGKNLGKSNETTPYEQACAEAQSKWTYKKDRKGYAENKPVKVAAIRPMLAKSYEKEKKKVKFPCRYQPKLDGMRCVAQKLDGKVTLYSRQAKAIDTLPHIVSILEARMEDGEICDGELYIHSKQVTFQTLLSWIKRAQPDSVRVQYHIYDMISTKSYDYRFDRMCELVAHQGQGIIKTVYTDWAVNFDDVQAKLAEQIGRGYEGIMLRVGDCAYKSGGRSSQLLKVKNFQDMEFEIVGAEENIGKHAGQCTLICQTDEGATFGVKPMGTDAQRRQYWTDWKAGKLKGKLLTVKFFEWTTSTPAVPRFPVGVAIRDYD